MKYFCSIIVILLFAVGPAFAQFYQYTDKNGNVVITDSPPADAEAQEKKIGENVYSFGKKSSDYPEYGKKRSRRGESRAEEKKGKNYSRVNVAMYMADW